MLDAGFPTEQLPAPSVFSLERAEDGVVVCLEARPDKPRLTAHVSAETIAKARLQADQAEPELVKWWALDLLGCHLANSHPEQEAGERYVSAEHRVGNGVPNFVEIQRLPPFRDPRFEHRDRDRIERVLVRNHGSVIIDGRTGSGKSALTALWAYRCMVAGAARIDLDLIDASDGAESVMSALLTIPPRAWYVVVMERVDTSLGKAQAVYALVDRLRREHGYDIAVLANGWLDLAKGGSNGSANGFSNAALNGSTLAARLRLPSGTMRVRTEPTKVFKSMVDDLLLSPEQVEAVRECCGGGEDLVLAKLALDYVREHGRVPSREEFTGHVGVRFGLDRMTDPEKREALYRFACLGMYEIEVPADEIIFRYSRFVEDFVEQKLIEKADTTYRIGSRSVAREMARYAYRNWTDADGTPRARPPEVAANTLRHAGSAQIQAALDRLDFISASRDGAPEVGRRLANAWKRRERIRKLMGNAVQEDHEWGDNAASAAFACMALRYLDLDEHWERCADWIRRRWTYDVPGALPIWAGEKSAEKVDFQGMTESMSWEDARLSPDRAWPEDLRGDRIDPDKAHRTWMLGVLLSFEGTAPEPDGDRLDLLYASASAVQQPNGAFYPERVPWVTARVLIGLCLAGYSDTKEARDAAFWLMNDSFNFGWKSGTGSWNTDLMTTAMCVIALIRYGLTAAEHQIALGLAELNLPTVQQPSKIDTSLVVEAMLISQPELETRSTAYDLLDELLEWASNEREWSENGRLAPLTQPERSGGEGESTKLPFVVSQLLPCIWYMVVNELATFFAEDFDSHPDSDEGGSVNGQRPVEPNPDRRTQGGVESEGATGPESVAGSESGADPAFGILPDAVLERARDRLGQIGRQLTSDIESRQRAVRGRNQREHLTFFQTRLAGFTELQRVYDACYTEFEAGPVTVELVERIDRLGFEIIGRSYEPALEETSP